MCRKHFTGDTIAFNIFMLGDALKDQLKQLTMSVTRNNSFVHCVVQPISLQ